MTLTIAADLTVSFFLVITIYYAAMLSRRLRALRADKTALKTLVQSLTEATQSAEAGIRGLKAIADETGRELQKKLQEAHSLREDLAYMIDRGGGVADRMETSLRPRRDEAEAARPRPVEPPRPTEAPSRREAKSGPANFIQEMAARLAPNSSAAPSRAERDLLRALSGRR